MAYDETMMKAQAAVGASYAAILAVRQTESTGEHIRTTQSTKLWIRLTKIIADVMVWCCTGR